MKKRTVALLCALVMIVGVAIGGTMAWLTAKADAVVNTFTTSDVNITLEETTGTEYQMVPGATLAKDPMVTVVKNSVDCYVFVKIDEANNSNPQAITYGVREGWTKVEGEGVTDTVYYRQVNASSDNQSFYILAGEGEGDLANGKVTVSSALTKDNMKTYNDSGNKPQLTFTAYAIQEDFLKDESGNQLTTSDIAKIWEMAQGNTSTNP